MHVLFEFLVMLLVLIIKIKINMFFTFFIGNKISPLGADGKKIKSRKKNN